MRGCPLLIGLLLVSGFTSIPAAAQQLVSPGGASGPRSRAPEIIPDRYIVELHPGASVDAVARAHGVLPLARFGIINGFLAHMSQAAAAALSRDPRVRRVSPDVVVHAFAKPSSPPGKGKGGGGSGGGGGTPSCPTPPPATTEQIPAAT